MLHHYFKVAMRNLARKPAIGLINIVGLSVGIACCILILVFVAYEISYEKWNPNAERIVRPWSDINFGGTIETMATSPGIAAPESADVLPDIEKWCRFRNYGNFLVRRKEAGTQNYDEGDVLTVDSSFFAIFPVPLVAGDPSSCLRDAGTVAISKSAAEKYFPSVEEAMGQILVFDNNDERTVTAVYEDIPSNTHFKADFLRSMTGNRELASSPPMWISMNFHTYFLLREGTDFEQFRKKFKDLSRTKMEVVSSQLLGMSLDDFEATGQYARFDIQRLGDIHLHSDHYVELEANGSIQYIWIFGSIAAFILLIACINFMNLATARSAHRAREIGMRKVLGSLRGSLVRQFLGETMILTTIAVLLGITLAAAVMPAFAELASRGLVMPWGSPIFWGALLVGIVGVGLLAGSYPAFFLSAFEPIKVLKGRFARSASHGYFRSSLVVFQFMASIVLIIATGIMYRQINFIQNKKVGFQKEQVIILNNAYALGDQVEAFKQRMLTYPGVRSATVSSFLPVPSSRSDDVFSKVREFRQDASVSMQEWRIDHDYLDVMGMEMVSGRFFDRRFPTDSSGIVINETAAALFGFDDPVGQKIYTINVDIEGMPTPEDFAELTILGVVKDFHFESLRENIGALSMQLQRSAGSMAIRYEAEKSSSIITAMESTWNEMVPTQPFSYRFMDDSFRQVYEAEQRVSSIALIFAGLAIFISCLGLFGLANYMAEQRTKEIGVRKVLGASVSGIVALLARDFLKLVLIALVLSIPIAWYFMDSWLSSFAYRIDIQIWIFIGAGLLALIIAFLTVSSQSIRAALMNPVRSLRSE